MTHRTKYRKGIAALFLTLMVAQLLLPLHSLALTSGPVQPEASSFKEAGVSDMVDLFTGDFKYNLPVMDIDGYPLNLSYQSGSNIDDEASWTGLGWNINVGAITRQMRGVPDDFSGDVLTTEHEVKNKVTVGGKVTGTLEALGFASGMGSLSGSLSLSIFSDNYYGIGAEIGANAGLSYSFLSDGLLTANMGLGLQSNTQSGVSVKPSVSLSYNYETANGNTVSPGLSATQGYNTRGGLKELSLGTTFGVNGKSSNLFGVNISYNTPSINPKIPIPQTSTQSSINFSLGPAAWLIFAGGGAEGYRNVAGPKYKTITTPTFGFLYAERAKTQPGAVMDFLREKESPVIPELPNLAVPIATPDLFSYTSQGGSGQFRLYRGGTGILADNNAEDEEKEYTVGFDAGVGFLGHGGINFYNKKSINATTKWTSNNGFMQVGDFQDPSTDPNSEHVFFKATGEKNLEDEKIVGKLKDTEPVAVDIVNRDSRPRWRTKSGVQATDMTSSIVRDARAKRRSSITYLTAMQAVKAGLDKNIITYDPIGSIGSTAPLPCNSAKTQLSRFHPVETTGDKTPRNAAHISEISVTDESGKRSVYGIPVYNVSQDEYSYAIGTDPFTESTNLIPVTTTPQHELKPSNQADNDHYKHIEKQPAYASSFLLTGILSPDYVDVTNNGITDDDLGTAVKFNYSRLPQLYRWRSPYGNNATVATVNRGLLADPDDNKASFVTGTKELWYIHSIETKTKVAYFITGDRSDGMGVVNWYDPGPGGVKQKYLKEIRLYSKADLTKPIKIVNLEYDYSLCPGVPNVVNGANGKLTLKKVYFKYGNSSKGEQHEYTFEYNEPQSPYGYLQTDRWGTYKPKEISTNDDFPALRNDEYPYTTQQNRANADKWAGTWQLKKIELPTGGTIEVDYEADDYGYVQNKKAMIMKRSVALVDDAGNEVQLLGQAMGVSLDNIDKSDAPLSTPNDYLAWAAWFKRKYLNDADYLYTKFFVNVGGFDAMADPQNENYYEFVPCYAKVTKVIPGGNDKVSVIFEPVSDGGIGINPIQHAAWQRLRMEYQRYAYPGYKNRIKAGDAGLALQAAVSAIASAFKNLNELSKNFYERARYRHFCDHVKLEKSMTRLVDINGKKVGGGARVKRVKIKDNWHDMAEGNGLTKTYGQEYDYSLKIDDTHTISSGVAAFEPSIGADENPLRMPVPYIQDIKGALNTFFTLEEPFGEYLFPAPTVGYSKVTVRDLNANGVADPSPATGYVVNEFYTAKEFPVITASLDNKLNQHGPSGWYSFFGGNSVHEMVFSQGYSVVLNDMHGKPKAVRIFNKSNAEISSTVYHYNAEPNNAGEMKLKNVVDVVDENGELLENSVIGRDIEVFTDMRQQVSNSVGTNVADGFDIIYFIFSPAVIPHWPFSVNTEYKLFRSSCSMKVVQYYGIVDKVVKTDNGSSVTSENVAYDGVTGEALITKTWNEFEDPIYTVNFPAWWMHPAMGGAYQTQGTVIPQFHTDVNGVIEGYQSFMAAGDELMNLSNIGDNQRYWVVDTYAGNNPASMSKKLVNASGKVVPGFNGDIKILRSGYRNTLVPPGASMVCLRNPISDQPNLVTGNRQVMFTRNEDLSAWKVLTASAVRFDDDWSARPECKTCPQGYVFSEDKKSCIIPPIVSSAECFNLCAGSIDPNGRYGVDGGEIYNDAGVYQLIKNDFWGGLCCPGGGGAGLRTADTYSAEQARQDSASWSGAQKKSAVTLLNSNSCARSYIPNDPTCASGFCGRLIRSGIWLCGTENPSDHELSPVGEWIGVEFCLKLPRTGKFYLGYAADNIMKIRFNDVTWQHSIDNLSDEANYKRWHVRPYTFNSTEVKVSLYFYNSGGPAAAGFEVYDNTYTQLINNSGINTIFSSSQLPGNDKVQVIRNVNETTFAGTPKFSCPGGAAYDACSRCGISPIDYVVNPYVKGLRGNWRPAEIKVLQVNTSNNGLFNDQKKGADVRNGGTLTFFKPFWYKNSVSIPKWESNTTVKEWVTANTITLYDKYGQELENKDALGRYSAAGFVFRGQLPGGVASNALNREIFYDAFEDYKLDAICGVSDNDLCMLRMLKNGSDPINAGVTKGIAHSGNYSLSIGGGVALSTDAYLETTKWAPYTFFNNKGEYVMEPAPKVYPLGFEPKPGGRYVFSAWVKDNAQPTANSNVGITLNRVINDVSTSVTLTRKAYVEKWSLVEGVITIPPSATSLRLEIAQDGAPYIDDIRIHPFDSHMKTYAYDDRNLRLMAEMDENNFATFYEYDDEGSLVRVKKETDRGIMTIKENRSSQRKKPTP